MTSDEQFTPQGAPLPYPAVASAAAYPAGLSGNGLPLTNPMAQPVKIVGICFAVAAVLMLIAVLFFMGTAGAAGAAATHNAPAGSRAAEQAPAQVVATSMMLGAVFSAGFAVIGLLTLGVSIGLLRRQSWGRMAAIIVSCPLLLSIPFGTALGGYTLYLMLKSGAKEDYARLVAGV